MTLLTAKITKPRRSAATGSATKKTASQKHNAAHAAENCACSASALRRVRKTENRPLSDFLVPAAGLEPARCCHRGILSPLRLPVSPRRHAPSHRTTAANTCQAQETRTAAARTSPNLFDKSARQPPIPDTRLLHPSRKFDKIINYFYRYRFWIRGTLHL